MSQVSSSAADLTASLRRTCGTRPPPLVGCSVTLLGDSIYVFGGRLVTSRTMVQTLYKLDLLKLEWKLLSPSTKDDEKVARVEPPPQARYFHSCCSWGTNKLVIFGGEGYNESTSTTTTEETSTTTTTNEGGAVPAAPTLETLNDLHIYNVETEEWENIGEIKLGQGVLEKPKPRYAHLGVVCTAWPDDLDQDQRDSEQEMEGDDDEKKKKKLKEEGKSCLMIMGGQDIKNTYLHSTDILDLDSMTWIQTGKWERHIGTYRAIATTSNFTVKPATTTTTTTNEESGGGGLTGLSWTEKNNLKRPEPLWLFSNFNFTQVRRDLDLLSSPLSSNPSKRLSPISLSSQMTGNPSLPPGLRFPSGFQLGNHLIIFGTFLSSNLNNFSIWSLNLGKRGAIGIEEEKNRNGNEVERERGFLEWMRIDPGNVLQKGSWNRAVGGWRNNVIVLGDRERDIAADYDHRQTNFNHLVFIDLEAHGIYQPPPKPLPRLAESFGLLSLSQPLLSDFEIVCSDGKRLACCRKILQDRWSWFNLKVLEFRVRASGVVAAQQKRNQDIQNSNSSSVVENTSENGSFNSFKPSSSSSPLIGGVSNDERSSSSTIPGGGGGGGTSSLTTNQQSLETSEALLTPRTLSLPEHSSTVLAFLQYLYTLNLSTPLQLSLPVLTSLLNFSKIYPETNLRALVVHALHEWLGKDPMRVAPAVYEAATLGGCTALQVRSLKCLMMLNNNGATRTASGGGGGRSSSNQVQGHGQGSGGMAEPMARQASQDVHGSSSRLPSAAAGGNSTHNSASIRIQVQHRRDNSSASVPFTPSTSVSISESPFSSRRNDSFPGSPPSVILPPTPPTRSPLAPFSNSSSSSSTSASWITRRDSLIGVYSTAANNATSCTTLILSNSVDSTTTTTTVGKNSSPSSSSSKVSIPRLETQLEEEEGMEEDIVSLDPHVQSPTSPIVQCTKRSNSSGGGILESFEREEDQDTSSEKQKFRRFRGLLTVGGGVRKQEKEKRGGGGEVYYPTFLDSVQVMNKPQSGEGGLVNPLSTRKATPINLEHLTLLESGEETFSQSELGSLLSPSGTSRSNASQSSVSLSSSSLIRQQQQRTPSSIPMNRKTPSAASSNSAQSLTEGSEVSELETPPTLSIPSFDPTIVVVEEEDQAETFFRVDNSPSPSPRFPRFFDSKKQASASPRSTTKSSPTLSPKIPIVSRRTSISSSPNSSSYTTPPTQQTSTPSSSRSSSSSSKAERLQLEIELGTKLLKASGASEKEIKLRARSVGFQVLKARETGKELPSGLTVPY